LPAVIDNRLRLARPNALETVELLDAGGIEVDLAESQADGT